MVFNLNTAITFALYHVLFGAQNAETVSPTAKREALYFFLALVTLGGVPAGFVLVRASLGGVPAGVRACEKWGHVTTLLILAGIPGWLQVDVGLNYSDTDIDDYSDNSSKNDRPGDDGTLRSV